MSQSRVLRSWGIDENPYCWICTPQFEYLKLNIIPQTYYNFIIGPEICPRCHSIKKLYSGLCTDCIKYEEEFYTRLNCIYNKQDSLVHKSCTKQNPVCSSFENTKYCFQSYVVYIGRFGDITKVGISRSKRNGGYLSRLREQGLDEAIVIHLAKSLPEAIQLEQWFIDIGLASRIRSETKLNLIRKPIDLESVHIDNYGSVTVKYDPNPSSAFLHQIWTFSLLKERFPKGKFEYFVFKKKANFDKPLIFSSKEFKGKFITNIGKFLFLENNKSIKVFDTGKLENRIIKGEKKWL